MSRTSRAKCLLSGSSKTDPEGRGENLYICDQTRRVLKRYRKMGDISEGALFRRIRRGDHIHNERLTAHSARRIIKSERLMPALKVSFLGTVYALDLLSRWQRRGLRLSICKSRGAGNPPRCRRIMRKRNLLNAAQLHGSGMVSDSTLKGGCDGHNL